MRPGNMECLENRTILVDQGETAKCPNDVACVLEVTIVVALTFLLVVGNSLSLFVPFSTPSLRNCHGYLIISLSASDLLLGIVAFFSIYPSANFPRICWPHGETACAVTAYLGNLAIFTSLLTLTLLSVERYIALVFPFKYSLVVTKKSTITIVLIAWIGLVACQATIFAGFPGYVYIPEIYACMPDYLSKSSIQGIVVIFGINLPCVLVIVVTSCVVRFKLTRSSRLRNLSAPTRTPRDLERSSAQQEARVDKFAKMVRIMTLTLILTWVPFLAIVAMAIAEVNIPQPLVFGGFWLLTSNSFLNTVIYFVMNSAFREAAQKIIKSLIPEACLAPEALFYTKCCARWTQNPNGGTAGKINTAFSGSTTTEEPTDKEGSKAVTTVI